MTKKRKRGQQGLNARQKAFVQHYAACGNATQAARLAGYSGSDQTLGVTGHDLLKLPKVSEAIAAKTNPQESKRIATAAQIQQLWTEVLNNPKVSMGDRLKASELLGKVGGMFIKKVENTGKVIVEVKRGNDAPAALQGPETDGEEA